MNGTSRIEAPLSCPLYFCSSRNGLFDVTLNRFFNLLVLTLFGTSHINGDDQKLLNFCQFIRLVVGQKNSLKEKSLILKTVLTKIKKK
jgi:hypothetical protein